MDDGFTGAQIFYGLKSRMINAYGFKSKAKFPKLYQDFCCNQGAPSILRRDNAKEENSAEVEAVQWDMLVKDEFSELYFQHQNPVEGGAIKPLKASVHTLLN